MSSNPKTGRSHRKRPSALRLSTDTFSTLPEYLPTGWHQHRDHIVHSDEPPDYPDSAEEADEDTDQDLDVVAVPQPVSPRRGKRSHKRRHSSQQQLSSTDPHLDSLLERSVHALEMSNTLLQSSISTQTSLSAVLALDSPMDSTLETRAHTLSWRIKNNWDAQASWADDLEEISKNVEGLLTSGMSCSLPSSSLPNMRKKSTRRPSLDLHQASADTSPARLHYSPQPRSHLIAPPPRALTQYVTSTQDSESILLPSTLGLRSSSSVYRTKTASSSMTSLLSTPSLQPKLTDKPLEPSTPAYTMLSSFVYRAPSSGSSTPSFTPSFISKRRNSSNSSASTERGHRKRPSSLPGCQDRCKSATPGGSLNETLRPMTPPVEESSSSSDSCIAKRTVQSLRKILDDQPTHPHSQSSRAPLRAPPFLPRTPAPMAEAGTSTATASISRLFTKGKHSSSTRPSSPPRQSAMKRSPASSTSLSPILPTPTSTKPNSILDTPLVMSFPDMFVKILGGSTPSSGLSTPSKRISFAELPESYASTKPGGNSSSKFKDKQNRKKRKSDRGGANGSGRKGKEQSSPERNGWWGGWLTTGNSNAHGLSLGMSLARQEERMEDRTARNWGGRMGFSNSLDDWAV